MRDWIHAAAAILAASYLHLASRAGDAPREVNFTFREGLIWLKVESPQAARPLNFLLDTGSAVTVISANTARELGLSRGTEVPVQGVRSRTTGFWQRDLHLICGPLTFPTECLEIDLSRLSGVCSCAVDGLLGADFIDNKIIQLDFKRSKLRLLPAAPQDNPTLTLKRTRGAILVPIEVGGAKPKWARFDTGCASPLQWVASAAKSARSSHHIAVGLAALPLEETCNRVRFGGIQFEEVVIGLHRSPIFPGEAGLIGNGLLSRFDSITISTRHQAIWITERPTASPAMVEPTLRLTSAN